MLKNKVEHMFIYHNLVYQDDFDVFKPTIAWGKLLIVLFG